MRVVALVESEDHVCCRYRLAAFRGVLARAGRVLDIHPLPHGPLGRLMIGRGLSDADAVIVQRKLLPRWAIALLRRRVRQLIFDFDDAVWLRDSYSPRGFDDPKRLGRFRAIVAACDLVVAGNALLAEEATKHTDPARVVVIPTCVEPTKYPVREVEEAPSPESRRGRDSTSPQRGEVSRIATRPTSTRQPATPTSPRWGEVAEAERQFREAGEGSISPLQLVWVGSHSTLRGLERFAPTLSAIGRSVPGTRLKLVCDRFLTIPDLPVDECVWREDTEAAEIASADVGIGWVPDDAWSRGKCGLKLLQYHAAGLPVVANPVGVQAEIVRDGETGFLAATREQWVNAIARLTADANLRHRLGLAGRKQVEEKYSLDAGACAWLAALDD